MPPPALVQKLAVLACLLCKQYWTRDITDEGELIREYWTSSFPHFLCMVHGAWGWGGGGWGGGGGVENRSAGIEGSGGSPSFRKSLPPPPPLPPSLLNQPK